MPRYRVTVWAVLEEEYDTPREAETVIENAIADTYMDIHDSKITVEEVKTG